MGSSQVSTGEMDNVVLSSVHGIAINSNLVRGLASSTKSPFPLPRQNPAHYTDIRSRRAYYAPVCRPSTGETSHRSTYCATTTISLQLCLKIPSESSAVSRPKSESKSTAPHAIWLNRQTLASNTYISCISA